MATRKQLEFEKTINEIYALEQFAIKMGLHNIRALAQFLDNPQAQYPSIHIAGTNGKGSTAFFLANILREHGLKVGLYTSPHLMDYRERITVDGEWIVTDFIIAYWRRVKNLVYSCKATFFDVTTALAFDYFKYCRVDVAVIETGLGGRLDSTNIIQPEICVFTPVDFDHEKQLGNTLSSIAAEKAGIIKTECTVISARQDPEALESLKKNLNPQNTFIEVQNYVDYRMQSQSLQGMKATVRDRYFDCLFEDVTIRQLGDYQLENITLAYFVSRYYLSMEQIPFERHSFQNVLETTHWPGRLQHVAANPDIFFDVSHNVQGIGRTVQFLSNFLDKESSHLLIGLVNDKNHREIASKVYDRFKTIMVTEPPNVRKMDGQLLVKSFELYGKKVDLIKEPSAAFDSMKKRLSDDASLLVIGSHYLIGALLNSFDIYRVKN